VTRDQTPGTNLSISHIHVLLTSLGQHVPLKINVGFAKVWRTIFFGEDDVFHMKEFRTILVCLYINLNLLFIYMYIYIYTIYYIYIERFFSPKLLLPNFISIISPQLLSDKTRLGANGLGAKGAQLAAELALKMKLHRASVGCLVSLTSFRGCVELRLFFIKRNVFQRNVKHFLTN